MKKRLTISLLFVLFGIWIHATEPIKILAIGNSFSVDAVEQYLYELGRATGDSLVIGNAYVSGCSLERHWNNATNHKADYKYRKIVGGVKTEHLDYTLLDCIINEDWDYITFQQVSANSGLIETYFPFFINLLEYVKKNAVNRNVKFVFHRTWAYAKDSKHKAFPIYKNDQFLMYKAIVEATSLAIRQAGIDLIIPAGTAIQNGRTSSLGDVFCRDGQHLDLGLGRYTAACTWYEVITGKNVIGNSYFPDNITAEQAKVAQYAAHYAVLKPNKITPLNQI